MRVLIVDDETIIRVGLKSMIQWEKEGYLLVGEAKNGEEALEFVNQVTPDIIITDLKMPLMNGIQLIKTLKEQSYSGEIVVLSNYDDFNLVKEAMSEGAMEYLLKIAIDGAMILKVLDEAKEKVLAKREKIAMTEQLATMQKYQRKLLIQGFIKEFLYDEVHLDVLIKHLEDIGVNHKQVEESYGIFVYIYEGDSAKIQNPSQFIEGIINLIEDWVPTKEDIFVCPLSHKEFIIYNSGQQPLSAKKLKDHLNLYINSHVALKELKIKDFNHLKQELESFHGSIFFDGPVDFQSASLDYRNFTYKLQQLLEAKDKEHLLNLLGNTIELSIMETWYPGDVKSFILYLLDLLNQYLISWGCPVEERMVYAGEELKRLHRVEECRELVIVSINHVFDLLGNLKRNYYRPEIVKILEYMHGHLEDKITLAELANHVNLNESYLCRMFKKEVGQSITDYLNLLRIEKAKELLQSTDLLVKEVGAKVGIHNPYYFNRLFKKLTDDTPMSYREQNRAM